MIEIKCSPETERLVLGALMFFENHTDLRAQKAILKLTSDCFFDFDYRDIYELIHKRFNQQQPFNFFNILDLIPKSNQRTQDALHWVLEDFNRFYTGDLSFDSHVSRLITLAKLRKQLKVAETMIRDIKECPSAEESQEILTAGINEISGLSYRESKHGMSNIEIAEDYFDGKMADEIKIPTTCDQLNKLLQGGIMPKSLIIVAAGASVGKTGFSIYLTDIIARAQPGTESLFFSIEMEYKHIWMRHIGICAGKVFDKLSYNERLDAVTKLSAVPMRIYDTAMCHAVADIDFILTTARLRAMEKPISVIVVDYLTLVETKLHFERNDLKQSYITGKLAQLAIELNCTVIALSQINRGAANRGIEDRCPWPHDAADSSGGHRSASLWFGVDRPELYQEDPCYRNQFVVKCRKNRFGDTFETIFAFNEGTFAEVQPEWFRQPTKSSKNREESLFSSHGKDYYNS